MKTATKIIKIGNIYLQLTAEYNIPERSTDRDQPMDEPRFEIRQIEILDWDMKEIETAFFDAIGDED